MTITRKLYGLLIASLLFLAGVSATGYWGITSVEEKTRQVATTGAAIRNHVEDQVATVNISQKGALLTGIRSKLREGDTATLIRLNRQEQYVISWVGGENTAKAGQVGLSAVDPNCFFWNDAIEEYSADDAGPADAKEEYAKAAAGGA